MVSNGGIRARDSGSYTRARSKDHASRRAPEPRVSGRPDRRSNRTAPSRWRRYGACGRGPSKDRSRALRRSNPGPRDWLRVPRAWESRAAPPRDVRSHDVVLAESNIDLGQDPPAEGTAEGSHERALRICVTRQRSGRKHQAAFDDLTFDAFRQRQELLVGCALRGLHDDRLHLLETRHGGRRKPRQPKSGSIR